jgi:hypothetical protein
VDQAVQVPRMLKQCATPVLPVLSRACTSPPLACRAARPAVEHNSQSRTISSASLKWGTSERRPYKLKASSAARQPVSLGGVRAGGRGGACLANEEARKDGCTHQ